MSEFAGFTEVKLKCVACGEEKPASQCYQLPTGWLCAACDLAGRVWAARMARNPEKIFDVPIKAVMETLGERFSSEMPIILSSAKEQS